MIYSEKGYYLLWVERGRQNDNEMGSTRNDRFTGYGGFEYDNHSRSTAEDDSISVLIDGH